MSKDLLGILLIGIIIIGVIFGIFVCNVITELAAGINSGYYKKGHCAKGIGLGICSIFLGYILYQLINILILNL